MASSNKLKHRSRRVAMKRKRKQRALIVIGVAAFAVVFGGSYSALKNYVGKVKDDVICDNIYINDLNLSGMTKKEAQKALESQKTTDESKTVTLTVRDEKVEAFLKELGFSGQEDKEQLVDEAVSYGKKGNLWMRYRQMKRLEKEPFVIDEEYSVSRKKLKSLLKEKAGDILQGPENASLSRDKDGKVSIVAEKEGEIIDYKATVKQLNDDLNDNWKHEDFEEQVVIKTEKPEVTKADLKDMTDELGAYSTDAGGGERWTNLKTGSSMLNGIILQPGEELSVYDSTAPYDEEHGYAEGTAYENGQVVPSYGGGVCQVSTTLYNAVIYAELEVVERHPHSMTVDYVEPSRDAAIAGGLMDFRFKNSYDTPIYIYGEIDSDNQLRMIIYGKETRPKNRTIEFESETLSVDQYSVTYKINSSLNFGAMQYTGNPHTGREAQLWKVVYKDGEEVSREVFNTSYYQKADEVIEVGTAGGSAAAISALESAVATNDSTAINNAIAGISSSSGSSESSGSTGSEE